MEGENDFHPLKKEKTKKLSEETVTKDSEIEKLNDDCLMHIFQHLPIADKIRIEGVSKRWQVLSQNSWTNFTRLDSSFETWGVSKYPRNPHHTINSNVFNKIVNLCGKHLTSVSLSLEAFRKICRMTQNVQELHLFDILPHVEISSSSINKAQYELSHWKNLKFDCHCDDNDWREIIKWLLSHSGKITKLALSLCHNFYREEDFTSLFKTMKSLKSFHLTDCSRMHFLGNSLNHLPFDTIEEICLENVQNVDNYLLSSIIKKCQKLRKICLYRLFGPGIDSILEALVSQAKNVRNIDLRISGSIVKEIENLPQFFSNMSQLRNLEKLDFINAGGFVNDDFLEIIAKNCIQLTRLNIAGKNNVTDKGICNISKMKKLLFLDIRDIPNIISPPLDKIQNLEILCCWNCTKIKEAPLFLFLQKTHNLRTIDVRECPLVTTEFLHVADNVVKKRKCNKILEIYIERAKIPDHFFYEKHDLLTIGIGSFEGEKYGFKNILTREKIPQIRIQPNAT